MELAPEPTEIRLNQAGRMLTVEFSDGQTFDYSHEFLRVYSPSAEVRGHSEADAVLQVGKRSVSVTNVEPVGHYAVRISFDDGHNSGLYSFEWLFELGMNRERLWGEYLEKLDRAGASRDPLS